MMLTIHQVSCGTCKRPSETFDGAIYTPGQIREELKQAGWRRIKAGYGMEDQCPHCVANATRKKAA